MRKGTPLKARIFTFGTHRDREGGDMRLSIELIVMSSDGAMGVISELRRFLEPEGETVLTRGEMDSGEAE